MLKTTELIRDYLNRTDRPFKRIGDRFNLMFGGARRMNAIRVMLTGRDDGIQMTFFFPMAPEEKQMSGVREYLKRVDGRLSHGKIETVDGANEIMYSIVLPAGQEMNRRQIFNQLRCMLCFGAMMLDAVAEDIICLMALPDADAAGRADRAVLPELPYQWPDLPILPLADPSEEEGDNTTHSIDKPDASLF